MLFHGTSNTSPEIIYQSEEGFDIRYSREGLWGNAVYFAVNSSYSNNYCFKDIKKNIKQMFYARVNLGHSKELPSDKDLKIPPAFSPEDFRKLKILK